MTVKERVGRLMEAAKLEGDRYVDEGWKLRDRIVAEMEAALSEEREACARLAESQPVGPGDLTGPQQRRMKEQIAAAIRARK